MIRSIEMIALIVVAEFMDKEAYALFGHFAEEFGTEMCLVDGQNAISIGTIK